MLRRLEFDLWYLFRPPWDSGVSPPELFEFMAAHPAGRAIDLGCGTGTNVVTLAEHGWQVTGLDYSPRAIRIASARFGAAGVSGRLWRCVMSLACPVLMALRSGSRSRMLSRPWKPCGISSEPGPDPVARRPLADVWILQGCDRGRRPRADARRPGLDSVVMVCAWSPGRTAWTRGSGRPRGSSISGSTG